MRGWLLHLIDEIEIVLAARRSVLPRPKTPLVTFVKEVVVMGLKFKLTLSPPKSADVAGRKLSITPTPGTPSVLDLPATAVEHELVVDRDTEVTLLLADVDGSGNQSPWSAPYTFTAKDTFPPITPDIVGAEPLGEVDEAPTV